MQSSTRFASVLTWLLFLMCACLATTTASTPLPADDASDLKIALPAGIIALSTTPPELSATLPPADFTLSAENDPPGGARAIDNRDVFRLSVAALAALAQAPVDSTFSSKFYQIPRDPSIGLRLGGPGGTFESRNMIWGLTLATKYMADHNSFQNWRFTLHLEDMIVGVIWYINEGNNEEFESRSTNDREIFRRTEIAEAQSGVEGLKVGADIEIKDLQGPVLNLNQAMMVVVSGLSDIALYDVNQRVPNNEFVTAFPSYRGRLFLSFPWPAGSPPAWFTYRFILLILQKVALRYLPHTVCKPIRILIREPRGTIAGYGNLRL
ncbi:MAG: hypothetical protein Q9171_001828 [Xanthocarpia ochracea]